MFLLTVRDEVGAQTFLSCNVIYAEVSFSKENSKYESNLSSAFLFCSCMHHLKEVFKSPALVIIMCSMTRDDDEGLSISLQRRIEEH